MPIIGIMASANWASANASSFESIATVTASGGETSLSFTSIPGTYKSLQIRGIGKRNAGGSALVSVRFNSDTANNYADHQLYGDGSTVGVTSTVPDSWIITTFFPVSTPANTFGAIIFDVIDYANTSKYKTSKSIGGYDTNGSGNIYLSSGLWRSTSAITSIQVGLAGDAFASGSTFALYGIK